MEESVLQMVSKRKRVCKSCLGEIRFRGGEKDDKHGAEKFYFDFGLVRDERCCGLTIGNSSSQA